MRLRLETEFVPAHLGQSQAFGPHRRDLALNPTEARGFAVFEAALGHELHADADAEEWSAGRDTMLDGVTETGDGGEPCRAITEGALSGEHDAVCSGDDVWFGRDGHFRSNVRLFGGCGQGA